MGRVGARWPVRCPLLTAVRSRVALLGGWPPHVCTFCATVEQRGPSIVEQPGCLSIERGRLQPEDRTRTPSSTGAVAVAATAHVDEFQSRAQAGLGVRRSRGLWAGLGLEEPTNADERGGTLTNATRGRLATTAHVKVFRFRAVCWWGQTVAAAMIAAAARSTDLSASAHSTPNSGDLPTAARPRHRLQRQRPRQNRQPSDNPSQTRRGWLSAQRQLGRGAGPFSAATRDDLLVAVLAVSPEQAVSEALGA